MNDPSCQIGFFEYGYKILSMIALQNAFPAGCLAFKIEDPAVLTIIITCFGLLFAFLRMRQYPNTQGHRWFQVSIGAMMAWLVAISLQISSDTLECKLLWEESAWYGASLMPTAWAFFLYEYALGRKVNRFLGYAGALVAPLAILAVTLSNSYHGAFYGLDSHLATQNDRTYVEFTLGPLYLVTIAYIYVAVATGTGLAFLPALRAPAAVRSFVKKLLFVTMLPVLANLAYILGGVTVAGLDPAPFAFSLSLVGLVWLMADDRWVDVTAMGREVLFHNSTDPIFIVSLDGKLCDASPAAKSFFANEKLRPGVSLWNTPDIGPLLQRVAQEGPAFIPPVIQRDGFCFVPRIYPIDLLHMKSKLGWAITLVDVTAQETALQQAQAADLAKTQFLSTVSHELRTPLTVINGAIRLMNKGNLAPEQVERLVKMTSDNAETLAKLVDDLLDVQRIDNEGFKLSREKVDINQLAETALARIQSYQSQKIIAFSLENDGSALYVDGDPQRLGQVLANILSNAIKFSKDPGEVGIRLSRTDTMAQIRISDNGIGIPADARDKVFGRFTQVEDAGSRNRGGSGLGMHISRQILSQHQGTIDFESEMGKGTTFIVTLPLWQRSEVDVKPDEDDDAEPLRKSAG